MDVEDCVLIGGNCLYVYVSEGNEKMHKVVKNEETLYIRKTRGLI